MRATWQVIKMKDGGLLVYAPVAPTDECIALLNDLDAPVEYILLPTTLFEHKLFMGPFQVSPAPSPLCSEWRPRWTQERASERVSDVGGGVSGRTARR